LAPGSHWEGLKSADVILVIDSDLPWITRNDKPHDSARVFIVDGADPLRVNIGTWHIEAEMICRADAFTALTQIGDAVTASANKIVDLEARVGERRKIVEATHAKLVENLEKAESAAPYALSPSDGGTPPKYTFSVPSLIGVLKRSIQGMTPSKGENVLYLNESISNYPAVWMGLRAEKPGSVLSSGGSSLGWGLGAAVGASLGSRAVGNLGAEHTKGRDLIVVIVGDGSFMFGVPSSAYWMARRYETVCPYSRRPPPR
jgi:thiamine pyrophosphate-dependent acetolactate synthase large subunit-like protein